MEAAPQEDEGGALLQLRDTAGGVERAIEQDGQIDVSLGWNNSNFSTFCM